MDSLKTVTAPRLIKTRKGIIECPTYIPVTTFGKKYPLDDLVRPYLPRLAQAVMVSYHYAKQQDRGVRVPMMVDSGGFVSLFEKAEVIDRHDLGVIRLPREEDGTYEEIDAASVLQFQEEVADIAFTLDFPIPPNMAREEAQQRQRLTIANALWAIRNRRRNDLVLYACVQGWDENSYIECAKQYVDKGFDGIAIGGLIPRMRNMDLVLNIVAKIRAIHPDLPLHVFGLGQPHIVKEVFEAGADSIDSSAYVKLAAEGRTWGEKRIHNKVITPTQRMHIALCNLANATQKSIPLSVSSHYQMDL